jgi:hypothetical protein
MLRLGDGTLQTIAAGEVFPVVGAVADRVSATARIE